jgi:hypothetical protein
MKGFKTQHGSGDFFDKPMVLLNDIIQVLDLKDIDNTQNPREKK